MKKNNHIDCLNAQIASLQLKQENELLLLKQQMHLTYESLKPINLIKNTFKEMVSSPDFKSNIFKSALGLLTGYFSKKILVGSSHNPIKKVLGTVLEFAVANIVSNHQNEVVEHNSIH